MQPHFLAEYAQSSHFIVDRLSILFVHVAYSICLNIFPSFGKLASPAAGGSASERPAKISGSARDTIVQLKLHLCERLIAEITLTKETKQLENNCHKCLPIKDVRCHGGRGLVQCGHFSNKGSSSDANFCTFW